MLNFSSSVIHQNLLLLPLQPNIKQLTVIIFLVTSLPGIGKNNANFQKIKKKNLEIASFALFSPLLLNSLHVGQKKPFVLAIISIN